MLRIAATRIAKSQLWDSCSRLRYFEVGYFPRIGVHKMRIWTSSSATSIGTEENSLGVPTVRSRALIYIDRSKHSQRKTIQVQREHVTAE